MGLREVEFILGSNETISTRVLVDESSTVLEAMTRSGLLPARWEFAICNGCPRKCTESPNNRRLPLIKIRMGMLKQVESVWGEANG